MARTTPDTTTVADTAPEPGPGGGERQGLAQRLYNGSLSFDFIRLRNRFYVISLVFIVVAIGSLVFRGVNPGIEFQGGAQFEVSAPVTSDAVSRYSAAAQRAAVTDLGEVSVRTVGDSRITVQTRTLNPETEVPPVRAALAQEAGIDTNEVAYSAIGASWGEQITQKALLALVIFLVVVTVMIAVYFRNWKMSVAAMAALLHDLVLTVGVYSLVGFTVTPASVIGVLTILGYSLYDTVVVFDKVHENTRGLAGQTTRTYAEAANTAVNQVIIRSVNTTIVGVLPVAAILVTGSFVLGEGPLKDLALALFVGMLAGAYSSIFIATPLLVQMKSGEPDIQRHTARVLKRRGIDVKAPKAPAQSSRASSAARPAGRGGVEADNAALARAEAEVNRLDSGRADNATDPHELDVPDETDTDSAEVAPEAATHQPSISVERGASQIGVQPGARSRELDDRGGKRPQPIKKPRSQRRK